ncbi:MAG TPA: hypothetical protein VKA30_11995 [Actinomycetota bacterium]|nr:hypothetical protein [Actinomycetota bacterium]
MGFVLALLLIGVGLLGPIALAMWHQERWLPAGEWIRDNVSPAAVVAVPLAGAFVAFVGLMLVWPPAFVLAFTSAVALVYQLWALSREGLGAWFPPALVIPVPEEEPEAEEQLTARKAS